jgi:hypothetical protein
MNCIFDYIKNCWKGVASIVGILAIITAMTSFYSNIATSADIEKVKTDTYAMVNQLKKSMELDRDITRLNQVNDSLMKAKILQKTYPNDKDLKEDIKQLQEDKIKLQQRIDSNK